MIRVLQFIPAFDIGGVESLIMSIYRKLDKEKIQFDFLVETEAWIEQFTEIEQLGGKVFQFSKLNKQNPLPYIKQVKIFFKNNAKNYAAIHSHNVDRGILILYFAKKYSIGCRINHAHSDSFDGSNYPRILRSIVKINTLLSTDLFACSKQAGDFQYGKSSDYKILKNAIDTKKFSLSIKKRQEMREKLNMKNSFVVGHTGRFTYAKNHNRIIDIFYEVHKSLPNSKLLLIGDGPLKQSMESKVQELGLSEFVIFLGKRHNIEELLQAMDIFLLPSFYEGFCISLLEAQSVGLQCIASDVIPNDVKVTDLVHLINLGENNKKWEEYIIDKQQYLRKSRSQDIEKNGYDIETNIAWITEFYLNSCTS